jgi:hypothetical protein
MDPNNEQPQNQPNLAQVTQELQRLGHENQELRIMIAQILHNPPAPVPAPVQPAVPTRSVFRMPSVNPYDFEGKPSNKPAHELQNLLDNYLDRSKELCRRYGFAPDVASIQYVNQLTYVQFTSMGLKDTARIAWRRLPEQQRESMTWDEYAEWIKDKFGSKLNKSQAISALDSIRQTKSAVQYTSEFNQLVNAISIPQDEELLCHKYINGLQPHLFSNPTINNITHNLDNLQREAEKLDDLYYRRRVKDTRDPKPYHKKDSPSKPFHGTRLSQSSDLMELDNLESSKKKPFRRLTAEQKALFRSKGWCVYCQDKRHDTDNCDKLKARRQELNGNGSRSQIHVAAQADDVTIGSSHASM